MRPLWLVLFLIIASPGFSQDDGGSGDGDNLFTDDIGGFFGGNAGARGNQQVDRLADVRRWLAQANATPLVQDQERPLTTLIESEVKAMTEAFQTRFGHPPVSAPQGRPGGPRGEGGLQGQRGEGTPPAGRDAQAGQGQGRGQGAGFARIPPEEAAEMRRMNESLTSKVITALTVDQQTSLRKWQSGQIQTRRLEALKRNMTGAGVALTAEQLPQIDALYGEESQARTKMLLESNGVPDPAKVTQLETQTLLKVVRLLTPEQTKALTEARARSRPPQP